MTHPLPPLVAERLRALRERPAEPTDKGFGYPMLTLRESALAGNLAAMAAYCAGAGVELAPHGKTAMSPELAARQPGDAPLVHKLVGQQQPGEAEGPVHPQLADGGYGDAPGSAGQLAGGELG